MSINLITDPWLPVRRLSGALSFVRPADITLSFVDDPIVALDFPRPDWNAAVTEMLIGLLACVMAPEDDEEWARLWAAPPPPEELHAKLAPLAFAFNLGGDGPRCFQDLAQPDSSWSERPIEWLVLSAPSENALKLNTDFFQKREKITALIPSHTAAALITLQTYAPEGGPGFRTSMRGGGPLSTLVAPRRQLSENIAEVTLWDLTWCNTPSDQWCGSTTLRALGHSNEHWMLVFPWLAPTRTSARDEPTTPEQGHILQCFFGMPCRVRLTINAAIGVYQVCRTWWTKNYGPMYLHWRHPLSPYRVREQTKTAFKYRQGGELYRDWHTYWAIGSKSEPAHAVQQWESRLQFIRRNKRANEKLAVRGRTPVEIYARGYDFKKNKARGWLEARIPYFDPPPDAAKEWSAYFMATAKQLVAGANAAADKLKEATTTAKFANWNEKKKSWIVEPSIKKKACQDLSEAFWRETEPDFLDALKTLRNEGVGSEITQPMREDFLKVLKSKALHLFDITVGTDDLADQDARRIVDARSRLAFAFGETGDVRDALDIISAEARQKNAKRKAKKKEATA